MSELAVRDGFDVVATRDEIARLERERDLDGLQHVRVLIAGGEKYLAEQRGLLEDAEVRLLDVREAALRVERAIGVWLAENVQHEGGTVVADDSRLPDGITRDQSSKFQRLASIDEASFEQTIEAERKKGKKAKLSRAALLRLVPEAKSERAETFNQVNDNIGWARWSWNPVTGCLHDCDYCYARDLAERFYPQRFEPTFLEERLTAPDTTKLPKGADGDPAWRRVFTCSMADLFGKWVPQEWIDAVFGAIVAAPQWEYLCLTKFPQRLATLEWPDSVWAGTTVDRQARVKTAERSFAKVTAGVRWLSCEPLLEPLRFNDLSMFDWVVIGACTKTAGAPAFAPPFDWVVDLYQQAREAGCKVYLKHNLFAGGVAPGMEPVREWPR